MISCGADKSIYFRTAQKVRGGAFLNGAAGGTGGSLLVPYLRWQEVKRGESRAFWAW